MKIFKFDVDESFAKANNELLRDSNRLRISGLVLGILLITAARPSGGIFLGHYHRPRHDPFRNHGGHRRLRRRP